MSSVYRLIRRTTRRAACGLIFLVPFLSAQGPTTGSISGAVTDPSGAALADAKVTVTSVALVVPQSTVASSLGTYRFPSLPPGVYAVSVEAAGFSPGKREGITITAGFSATIDMLMSVAGSVQTVAVTAEATLLDTENTKVQNSFSNQVLSNLPNSRDMWSLIGIAPGLALKTFDVGGASMGTQIGYTSYGITGQQRVQMDGVNMTEATAATSAYTDYSAFEEVQMGTSGNDASMPSPGVQVNFIVKSGGNQFHGDFYQDYESSSFQGTNITQAQRLQGVGVGTRITSYHDTNGDIGGPIKRDKLWFFGSVRRQYIGTKITGYPVDNPGTGPPFDTILSNGTYKLTYQINDKNKISQMLNFERKQQPYRNASNSQYADAVYDQDLVEWIGNLEWNSSLSPNAFLNVRLGSWGYNWVNEAYANATGQIMPRRFDSTSGDTAGGFQPQGYFRRRSQLEPTLSYAVPRFLGLNHFFSFGFLHEKETFGFNQYPYLNGYQLNYASPSGSPDFTTPNTVQIFNSPTSTLDYVHHFGAYIQDKIKLSKRITLNAGFRWDFYNGYRPDQKINPNAPYTAFFYQGAALPNGYSIPAAFPNLVVPGVSSILKYPHAIAPRLGLAYDLFGNGRTSLKISWGRYYNNPGIDISNNVNPIRQLSYTFKWNAPANTVYLSPNQIGAFTTSTGSSASPIDPKIQDPHLDDYSAYIEHQVTHTFTIRTGFVYRKMANSWILVEQNRLTSLYTNPVTVNDPGPNGTGTSPLAVWDVPTTTPLPTSLQAYQTPDWNKSYYRNFEVTLTERMSNRFSANATFLGTWATGSVDTTTAGTISSQLSVTAAEPVQPNVLQYNSYSVYNSFVHVFATYRAKWGIVISPIYRYQLGVPMQRVLTVTGLRVGTVTIPTGPMGLYRGDSISILDTRIEKSFTFHDRFHVGLFFDAFNIGNSNAAQAQDNVTAFKTITVSGQKNTYERFLSPTTVTPPRVFRLGAKFTF